MTLPNVSGDEVESAKVWDYINAMLIKNLKMRRELLRQWARAHYGACSFEDCYTSHVCSWPLPPCVGDATEAEIQEASSGRYNSTDRDREFLMNALRDMQTTLGVLLDGR